VNRIQEKKFEIFDSHLHTYGTFLPWDENLLDYMDHFNVKKAVITTINRAASSKVYTSEDLDQSDDSRRMKDSMEKLRNLLPQTQLDHQDVIDLAFRDPDKFIKFFWFNPNVKKEYEDESYRILKDHFRMGFSGVKVHSGINLIKIPRDIQKLVSVMQEYNERFPLFIHSTPKVSYFSGVSSKDIANLAGIFPNLTIITGHAGYAMEYAIELGLTLKKYKNVYFETSCSIPYGILSLIKTIGHDRILFGSDAPVTNPLELEIEKITCLPLDDKIKQDILFNNAARLFNF
jgi:predicted TIM-barrel fold metal-dependent hydrolase